MAEPADIKQHLIRGAVRENVDVMQGRYRFKRPTKTQRLRTALRVLFLIGLPIVVFGAAFLVSDYAERWLELRSVELAERVVTDARAGGDPRFTEVDPADVDGAVPSTDVPLPEPTGPEALTAAALDRSVLKLGVRKIIVDPGHGGKNPGTYGPNGLKEKTLALDISKRLGGLLEEADFEVALTREEDEFISLEDRAKIANANEGDLFVSIHLNWLETRQVRGIETYYLGPTDDPFLKELAAAENQDSGYSLADFRKMLDHVFADVRQDESARFARSVQRSLFSSLRRINPSLQNRGVKKAPFIVLTGTEMPAILAEVACLSNDKEARLLMTAEYRQFIAEALFRGIENYARELNDSGTRGS